MWVPVLIKVDTNLMQVTRDHKGTDANIGLFVEFARISTLFCVKCQPQRSNAESQRQHLKTNVVSLDRTCFRCLSAEGAGYQSRTYPE